MSELQGKKATGNPSRCLIYGDPHLCSSNYGGHVDYAGESLENYRRINQVMREEDCGVVIGLGDFAQHRFAKLEYRLAVQSELIERNEFTDGNVYELEGNHDRLTEGMSERQFYIQSGQLKYAKHVDIGCVRLHLVNYKEEDRELDIDESKSNIVLGHNYFRFKSTVFNTNYGKGLELDYKESWSKIDLIVSGHIHDIQECKGSINGKEVPVIYPGCPNRQSYKEGKMDEIGVFIIIDGSGDEPKIERYEFDLRPLNEVFVSVSEDDLKVIMDADGHEIEKAKSVEAKRLDVQDIIAGIVDSDISLGDPIEIIDMLGDFSEEGRELAKELYKGGLDHGRK